MPALASSLGEAVIEITADTSGFRSELESGTSRASSVASKFGSKFASTAGKALKVAGVTTMAAAGTMAGAAFVKGFGRLNAIDQAQQKLKGLGYTGKAIDGIMQNVTDSVTGTAFGLDEAASSAAQALASGVKPGKQLTQYLTLVGDAASQSGAEFSDMATMMADVQANGKLTGETLAQMTDNGLYVLPMLSDALGKPAAAVKQMVSDGQVSAKQFSDILEKNIGGSAQAMGDTFTGSLKNMNAALGRLGADVLGGAFNAMPKLFGIAQDSLDKLAPVAEKVGGKIGSVFEKAAPKVQTFIDQLSSGKGAGGKFADAMGQVFDVAKDLGSVLGDLAGEVGDAGKEIGSQLGPVLQNTAGFIKDFIGEMKSGKGAGGDFRDSLSNVVTFLKNLATAAINAAKPIGNLFGPLLKTTGGVLKGISSALASIPTPLLKFALQATAAAIAMKKLQTAMTVMRTFTSGMAGRVTSITTSFSSLGTVMGNTRTAMSQANGVVGKVGAGIREIRTGPATSGLQNLAGAAKAAAGTAGLMALTSGLQSVVKEGPTFANTMTNVIGGALTGLAVGGPIGALIGAGAGGGLTALIGMFKKTQDASKTTVAVVNQANTKTAQGMFDALTASLNETTAAYSGTSRAAVSSQLIGPDASAGAKQLVADMSELGISTRTLTSALMGQPKATAAVEQAYGALNVELGNNSHKINENKEKIKELSAGGLAGMSAQTKKHVDALKAENSSMESRNKQIKKSMAAYDELSAGQRKSILDARKAADANKSLAQRFGSTKKEAEGFVKALPKSMRMDFRSNAKQTITSMSAVQDLVGKMKNPTNSQIKMALHLANIKPTKQNIKEVRQSLKDVGHTKADTKPWRQSLNKGADQAKKTARQAARHANENLRKTGAVDLRGMPKFTGGVRKGTKEAERVAKTGSAKTRRVIENTLKNTRPSFKNLSSSVSKGVGAAAKAASSGAKKTKSNAEKPINSTKANMGGLAKSVTSGISKAARAASTGGKNVGKAAAKGVESTAKPNMSGFQGAVSRGVAATKSTASSGGYSVGSAISDGAQSGVNARASAVASAAASMVRGAINAAKAAAKSKSPSKLTYQLGLDIDKGLEIGLNYGSKQVSAAGFAVTRKMLKQMEAGTDVSGFYDRARGKVSDQYEATNNSIDDALSKRLKTIETQRKKAAGKDKKLTDWQRKHYNKLETQAKNHAKAQRTAARNTRNSQNTALKNAETFFTTMQKKYNRYLNKLTDLRNKRASMISEVQTGITGELDLSTAAGGRFTDIAQVVSGLAGRAKQTASLTKQALKAGIPMGLVREVLAMGTVQAIPVLKSLLTGSKSQIKALSVDYAAISSYGKQAGTTLGDAFYKTGIQAQEGLIRGLVKQKGITRAANTLASKLTKSVRKALKISSPSKLMEVKVGEPTGQGIIAGAEKSLASGVDSLGRKLAMVKPVRPVARTSGTVAPAAATVSTGPAQIGGATINQNFYGPTTSGGRLREMDWTIRYATKARSTKNWDGVAV